MKKLIFVIILFCGFLYRPYAQVATQVIDEKHNETTVIETSTKTTSTMLKQFFTNPFFEKISKVQTFLKDAVNIVSAVVANMKMTRQLIEAEQDIYIMYVRSATKIQLAEDLEDKWKYKKVLLTLFHESIKIYEVFDLATQQNMGIIDDRGRIELIKQVLKKSRAIRTAMRVTLRRANQSIIRFKRKKKELEVFTKLF